MRVARRAKTRKQRVVERRQRRQEQQRVQAQIDALLPTLVRDAIEQALQGEVTAWLGRAKGERRELGDETEIAGRCNRCGTRQRRRFYRAGTYDRGLLTFDVWTVLGVPRLSCTCGGMVDVEFVHLAPYGRWWFDVEVRARHLAALCVSLRDAVEVLAWRNGQPLSIATVNGLVNETAGVAAAFQRERIARVPAVVMLDGLWVKGLEPTGEAFVDAQGRRRKRQKVRKYPLLVAFGVDPVSGERWVLDWEAGREEDEASWRVLLERLLARGLCGERGLELFIHDGSAGLTKAFELVHFGAGVERQRCIFHKLRNVRQAVVGTVTMSRAQRRERRTQVLADATVVYGGANEAAIGQRLVDFGMKWREQEPAAVATLERDFAQTVVYLRVQERARERGQVYQVACLRTTSALERVNRSFRQKTRQVVLFHSDRGVAAGIHLVISHRQLAGESTEPWHRRLEEALLAL